MTLLLGSFLHAAACAAFSARACVARGVTRTLSRMSASCGCSGIKSAPAPASAPLSPPCTCVRNISAPAPLTSWLVASCVCVRDQSSPCSSRCSLPHTLAPACPVRVRSPLPSYHPDAASRSSQCLRSSVCQSGSNSSGLSQRSSSAKLLVQGFAPHLSS